MTDNYCGKNCIDCARKEQLNCQGCLSGPGRQNGGDCELAKCCRDKGHETCATCGFGDTCILLKNCESVPETRIRKLELEIVRKETAAKNAPVLGKWLWILFWLIIPNSVAGLLFSDAVSSGFPQVYLAGQILGAIGSMAYGFILLQLVHQEARYKTAGTYAMIAAAVGAVLTLFSDADDTQSWTLVFSLPASIIALLGEYNEFMAHSAVLVHVNVELSQKWADLWKWNIGCYGALIGGILILLIIPILGSIITIGGALGLAIVSITKLVYLYRTARLFREYEA